MPKQQSVTWRQLYDDWVAFKSVFVSKRTVESWYKPLRRNVIKYLGKSHYVTRRDAIDFVSALKAEGLALDTVKRRIEALDACWKWGMEEGFVTENPWRGLARLIKVPQRCAPKPFSASEVERIIKGFEEHPVHHKLTPFVKFLFATGCRTGEAIGLRWSDVADDCSYVNITSQFTRGERKPPKAGKNRTLYLPASMQQMLMEMKKKRQWFNTLVFPKKGDRPIDDANFRHRAWISVLKLAYVPYRKPYNTRHTFISHALEQGMSPVNVAAITGHDLEVLCKHYAGLISKPIIPDIFSSEQPPETPRLEVVPFLPRRTTG